MLFIVWVRVNDCDALTRIEVFEVRADRSPYVPEFSGRIRED
jgi:hypothetical protein